MNKNTKTIHKNDTITSKRALFRAFFNLVKIRQKKYLKKNFWVNFGKNGKRDTPFSQKSKKIVKKLKKSQKSLKKKVIVKKKG